MLNESEDDVLSGLLNPGVHKGVEGVVDALQAEFLKKVAWGGVGGKEAEALVRDSFAVIIKLSGLGGDVATMASSVEVSGA